MSWSGSSALFSFLLPSLSFLSSPPAPLTPLSLMVEEKLHITQPAWVSEERRDLGQGDKSRCSRELGFRSKGSSSDPSFRACVDKPLDLGLLLIASQIGGGVQPPSESGESSVRLRGHLWHLAHIRVTTAYNERPWGRDHPRRLGCCSEGEWRRGGKAAKESQTLSSPNRKSAGTV